MTVHLFGATSSPGCSNFALNATADDHEAAIGSAATEFLRRDIYVDDSLKSVASVEEAIDRLKRPFPSRKCVNEVALTYTSSRQTERKLLSKFQSPIGQRAPNNWILIAKPYPWNAPWSSAV